MSSDELIHNQQELLSALGLEDPADLADFLWAYVDGVVYFHDEGIDLQPGFQTGGLRYPFTVQQLLALAAKLEESEVPMQAAAGGQPDSPTAVQASKARVAKDAHDAFRPEAARLAEELLGGDYRVFSPRAMTTFAFWYEDQAGTKLAAIVAPTEVPTVTDEVLAYALAWQHDRELILVLSDRHTVEVTRRLPWIEGPVTVRRLAGQTAVATEAEVLAAASRLNARTVRPFALDARRAPWVERLLADPVVRALDAHPRANYLSWHFRGLQVLRLSHASGGLRLAAGVQYSQPQPNHKSYNKVLTGALTDEELALALDAVAESVAAGGSLTTQQTEHRLQSGMGAVPPAALGLPYLAREYPGYRGPGRPGFIDFLGCDPVGTLHVVETKIGHDPKVVLQALDYGIWVRANEQSIRSNMPHWPRPESPQSAIHLDLVLSRGKHATAVGPYIASQLEALRDDVHWRVFVVDDAEAFPVVVTPLDPDSLWTPKAGVTSPSVRPRRGTAGA